MLRLIATHLLDKLTSIKSDSNNENHLKNAPEAIRDSIKLKENDEIECLNQMSTEKPSKNEAVLAGRIIYAEAADSEYNSLFEIKVNNDKIHTVYLPNLEWNAIENDRVMLYGLQDASGEIEFTDLQPKKKKNFEFGRVTEIEENYAVFENKTIMKFDSIDKYPILKMFDEYKFEAVESDQKCNAKRFDYRVIKLIEKIEIKQNHVEFEYKPIKILIDNERETKTLITRYLLILNKSKKSLKLINLRLIAQTQCPSDLLKLDKENIGINYTLKAQKGFFKVYFKIQPIIIGNFDFELVANFDNFKKTYRFSIEIVKSYILPGQHIKKSPRFFDVRIDDWLVPEEMKKIDFNKVRFAKEELMKTYPELTEDLTRKNYIKKMRLGIYLEEIALEKAFAKYRIERGVFERKDDSLRLIVKDVAEKRPSIVIGDKIIATDPFRTDDERPKYEAFIFKVEHDAILCKFHDDFHKLYKRSTNGLPEFYKNHNEKEYTIEFHFSRYMFKRQQHALMKINSKKALGMNFLFPSKKISCNEIQLDASLKIDGSLLIDKQPQKWFNSNLNKYQKSAIINVLRGQNRPLPYIIFGCPGSGKTRTIVETILQIYTHVCNSKLIIATPSNSAANLITEMLLETNFFDKKSPPFLRIVSNNQVERDLIPECIRQYCGTVSIAAESNDSNETISRNNRGIWQNCTKSKIQQYRMIIGTLNCIGLMMQMDFNSLYSHVIIDEAGQSIEPETIIPLTLLNTTNGQCVMAGDPLQLGPILLSQYGKMFNLNVSMLERLLYSHSYYARKYGPENNDYDANFVTKLKTNYRSHPSVLRLYNDLFYNGELETNVDENTSAEALLLANKTENVLWKNTNRKCGVYFVNVENGKNKRHPDSSSWYNDLEIKKIISFLMKCSSSNIPYHDIGIVTPYSLQVKKLREQIHLHLNDTGLKIGTVEEFQGQERMVVIVSTVRTNKTRLESDPKFGLGFIQCPKRMNVAISRARALLIVFGKESILELDEGWRKLIEYTKNNNTYVVETC